MTYFLCWHTLPICLCELIQSLFLYSSFKMNTMYVPVIIPPQNIQGQITRNFNLVVCRNVLSYGPQPSYFVCTVHVYMYLVMTEYHVKKWGDCYLYLKCQGQISNLVSSVVAHHILYVFLFGHGKVSGIKMWSLWPTYNVDLKCHGLLSYFIL